MNTCKFKGQTLIVRYLVLNLKRWRSHGDPKQPDNQRNSWCPLSGLKLSNTWTADGEKVVQRVVAYCVAGQSLSTANTKVQLE